MQTRADDVSGLPTAEELLGDCADGRAFAVTVASTGETIRAGADETLLAALGRAGVPAAYSSQQGFCGTCRTGVVAGSVDHRDTLLAAEGSDLTLDL